MKKKKGLNNKNLFVFIIGLLTYIQIQVLGTFGIAELIVLVVFPFIRPFKQFKELRLRKLSNYLLIGIFGLIISNIINEVSLDKSLKGTFFLIMLYCDIPFVYWMLKDNYRRIFFYLAGYALSNILVFLFFPTSALSSMIELADGDTSGRLMSVWFVYFMQPTAVFFGAILYYKNKKKTAIIVIQLFAFYALFNSSRNIFLIWTIIAFILMFLNKLTKENSYVKKIKFTPIIVLFIICLFSTKGIYESLASDGSLGEDAKNKYIKQKYESGNIGLLASRIEFFIALKGIIERPIFGYGSYPNDDTKLKERTYQDFGINLRDVTFSSYSKRLSGHSHILNSYLYGGFLGVFFWIYAMRIVILFLRKHLFYEPKMIGLFLIMSISWIWDYLFSPFAFRLQESIFLITIILIIKSSENSNKNVERNTIHGY